MSMTAKVNEKILSGREGVCAFPTIEVGTSKSNKNYSRKTRLSLDGLPFFLSQR